MEAGSKTGPVQQDLEAAVSHDLRIVDIIAFAGDPLRGIALHGIDNAIRIAFHNARMGGRVIQRQMNIAVQRRSWPDRCLGGGKILPQDYRINRTRIT